jgi:hypothetical protein
MINFVQKGPEIINFVQKGPESEENSMNVRIRRPAQVDRVNVRPDSCGDE